MRQPELEAAACSYLRGILPVECVSALEDPVLDLLVVKDGEKSILIELRASASKRTEAEQARAKAMRERGLKINTCRTLVDLEMVLGFGARSKTFGEA
ncbi:MAG: hypothetical protein JWO51_182 [Rhodospirillales bacterium]|nr:hypothetical protein [Rhodospirillales bacterium]